MEWARRAFVWIPTWAKEPDIRVLEQLARQELGLADTESEYCHVAFFAEGGFNKLYSIDSSKGSHLLRVTLPVCPSRKTLSEVATILWLRANTTIPVPGIVAYDATSDNEIGCEWILMEKLPGQTLGHAWKTMDLKAKTHLVKEVASFQTQLLRKGNFDNIGNLYMVNGNLKDKIDPVQKYLPERFQIGPMVSTAFFLTDRTRPNTKRGPFTSSKDWLELRTKLLLEDLQQNLEAARADEDENKDKDEDDDEDENEDEDDIEEAEAMLSVGEDIQKSFKEFYQMLSSTLEVPTIWHDDLSMANILVGENYEIAGIVDWEAVSALPTWYTRQFPCFLEGPPRQKEPKKETYIGEHINQEELDGFDEDSMYWEHLLEYEQTILRPLYLQEMERLNPGFAKEREENFLQTGFDYAILQGDNVFMVGKIRSWLADVRKGVLWDLRQPESNEVT